MPNSPVGESECNGRAENAMRQVDVRFRTPRSALEANLKAKLYPTKPFATWLVRWAGEVLTKYRVGKDGLTAWQRRHGEEREKPIAIHGGKNAIFASTDS